MTVYPTVIVGTDGSRTAGEAVERSAVLAHQIGAPLIVTAVFHRGTAADFGPPSLQAQASGDWRSADYRAASDVAQDASGLARKVAPGVDVDTATLEGDPADKLLDLAESRAGSLLAVGSQGLTSSARFLLGNVPHKVSHHPVGDVLIVRTGSARAPAPYERMLVATDGSRTADRAVGRAVELAAAVGAALTVLTVDDDESRGWKVVDAAGAHASAAGVSWQGVVHAGDPAGEIVRAGAGEDLVVVGNVGMAGAARFVLGGVPNKVTHHIGVDLLICKTRD